ncbi:hypothetical protein GCM10009839_47670 [Catenulispora yoronensis]|uniref:Lipoprotein signal peptidase n=1 Tax=Catenulispora yoronensis TaxID=450799 RepID=A0ABP5G782_9ACTN
MTSEVVEAAAAADAPAVDDAVDGGSERPGAEPSGSEASGSELSSGAEPSASEPSDAVSQDSGSGAGTGPDVPVSRKPRRLPVLIAVAALALAIDVISKMLVVQHLTDRDPIHVPGGFLNLTLIRNSGAAFSIGEGQTWVFTIIAGAVVFVILRVSRNLRSLPWACALGLLLGGALGNLSDRIFREPGLFRGHVVDFLQFPTFPLVHYDFPVFNLADSAIVAGGCLMVLLSFLGMQPDGSRHTAPAAEDDDASSDNPSGGSAPAE